jgi:cytochrome b6-f complex iron-sulfur subunit
MIVLALAGVLIVAAATVMLLGRNAARAGSSEGTSAAGEETSNEEVRPLEVGPPDAADVEATAGSAQVSTRVKEDEAEVGISRRRFLNRSIYAVLGIGFGLPFAGSLLAFLIPTGKGGFGGLVNVTTPLSDIVSQIIDQKKPFYIPEARAYIAQYPKDNAAAVEAAEKIPAYELNKKVLAGMTTTGIVALYQKCPHLGCRVPWCESSQWFECPCHGSKYNRVGEKRAGPAPRGMDRFPFDVVSGKLVIDTATVVSGPPIGTDTTRQGAEGPLCV